MDKENSGWSAYDPRHYWYDIHEFQAMLRKVADDIDQVRAIYGETGKSLAHNLHDAIMRTIAEVNPNDEGVKGWKDANAVLEELDKYFKEKSDHANADAGPEEPHEDAVTRDDLAGYTDDEIRAAVLEQVESGEIPADKYEDLVARVIAVRDSVQDKPAPDVVSS